MLGGAARFGGAAAGLAWGARGRQAVRKWSGRVLGSKGRPSCSQSLARISPVAISPSGSAPSRVRLTRRSRGGGGRLGSGAALWRAWRRSGRRGSGGAAGSLAGRRGGGLEDHRRRCGLRGRWLGGRRGWRGRRSGWGRGVWGSGLVALAAASRATGHGEFGHFAEHVEVAGAAVGVGFGGAGGGGAAGGGGVGHGGRVRTIFLARTQGSVGGWGVDCEPNGPHAAGRRGRLRTWFDHPAAPHVGPAADMGAADWPASVSGG